MENIQKPITLLREDFIKNAVELCNTSGLPLFVVEDVLKGLLQEIHVASAQQVEADRNRYEAQLKKE